MFGRTHELFSMLSYTLGNSLWVTNICCRCLFYLVCSYIQRGNGEIDKDVTHAINVGWMKWRHIQTCAVKRCHKKIKASFIERWLDRLCCIGRSISQSRSLTFQKMKIAEMRMLWWIWGHTWIERIQNEEVRDKVGVTSVKDKMQEVRLRWFVHVNRRCTDAYCGDVRSWLDGFKVVEVD